VSRLTGDKLRAARKRYRSGAVGKAARRRHQVKYLATDHGKERYREYARRHRAGIRALLAELKSGPCTDCGGTFDPVCMDFDHRDGTDKVADIARMIGYGRQTLLAEIAKCDLVCANRHRIRTHRLRDHAALIKASMTGDNKKYLRREETSTQVSLPIDSEE